MDTPTDTATLINRILQNQKNDYGIYVVRKSN